MQLACPSRLIAFRLIVKAYHYPTYCCDYVIIGPFKLKLIWIQQTNSDIFLPYTDFQIKIPIKCLRLHAITVFTLLLSQSTTSFSCLSSQSMWFLIVAFTCFTARLPVPALCLSKNSVT